MRTANCGLRSANCGLRSANCELRTANCGLRSANSELRTANCGLRSAVLLVLILACTSHNLVRNVSSNDFALVREGRYQGNVRVMNDDPQLKQLAEGWRSQIEADPTFLRGIADRFFSLPDTTEFRFMYVGKDSVSQRVILRYFGFAPKPFIIAGWQVQFVFDLGARSLKAVYAEEVPLE